jgi:hypothetical protein
MKITSILSDELIQELFDAYVEVHNVKKALKGEDGKVGDGEFKFEDRFIQAGSDHLLRVALIIGDETIFV